MTRLLNEEGYRIMNICGATHRRFGELIAVSANPIINTGGVRSFSLCEGEDTSTFYYPLDDDWLSQLLEIARAEKIWFPGEFEFLPVTTSKNGKIKTVYCHRTCYDERGLPRYHSKE